MTEFSRAAIAEHAFVEHEHRELRPGLNHIHDVAGAVGSLAAGDFAHALREILDWVHLVLEPHTAWENTWLYPEFDRRAGTPWATRLLAFEHQQICQTARQLESDRDLLQHELARDEIVDLRWHLYALEALVRAHIEREERLLIPLLDS